MRYCSHCGTEYGDEAESCSLCLAGGLPAELCDAEELARRRAGSLHRTGGRDTRQFVRAGTADDPLTAERLARLLDAACIPVFARDLRGGTVDPLTTGMLSDWWEMLVPAEDQARAAQLIAEEKQRLAATADEAARAAEEEEREGEAGGAGVTA